MKKIKQFFKRLFCKHDYYFVELHENLGDRGFRDFDMRLKVCKKCARVKYFNWD